MAEHAKSPEAATLIVFQQELRVRLVNLSRTGCLLEVSRPVRVGTVGRLCVVLGDAEYADDVRVARCTPGKGANCELGLELLRVPKPKEPRRDAPSLALMLDVTVNGPVLARLQPTGT